MSHEVVRRAQLVRARLEEMRAAALHNRRQWFLVTVFMTVMSLQPLFWRGFTGEFTLMWLTGCGVMVLLSLCIAMRPLSKEMLHHLEQLNIALKEE